jgi:hypothetical protein
MSIDSGLPASLIGAGLVVLGQGLTHRYTVQREVRRERADAVDRTAAALATLDRRVAHFQAWVGTGRTPDEVQEAADEVDDAEVELRQATFSLRIRLPAGHVLPSLFESAEQFYTASYVALAPLMAQGDRSVLGQSFHYFELARQARRGVENAARDFFRYGPLVMALRALVGYRAARSAMKWRPAEGSAVELAARALTAHDVTCDEDGWIPLARIQEEARAGLQELAAHGWAETDDGNRWRSTGAGFGLPHV